MLRMTTRAFLFGLLFAAAAAVQAAEITVFSSNALKSVLEELVPQFEKSAGHKVTVQFAPAAELKARIDKREAFDVAILTAALMDELAKESRIAGISRANVARAGAGVAIRKGAPKPDLATAESFKSALLSAKSVAYVGAGATGANIRAIFERFGIAEEMKAKTRLLAGVSAADAVAQGEAELGFTMISEILPVAGAELAGPLPPEVQVYTVFPAAMSSSAREPAAAYAFVRFLKTPEAVKVIREKGMEPG
jgi:molybdate transport system substrate-binding protein